MTSATPASDAPQTSRSTLSTTLARLPKAIVIVLVLLVLPAVIGALLGGPAGGPALLLGMIGGLAGAMARGYATARAYLPLMAAGLVLGGLTAGTWWWVVIGTAFAALAGWSVAIGMAPLFILAALFTVAAKPIAGLDQVLITFAFVMIGGMFGSELARRGGAPAVLPGTPARPNVALASSIALGAAVGVGCTTAHLLDAEHGYWIPMTILILAQPAPQGRGRKTRDRLLGTGIGFVIVVAMVLLDVPRPVYSVLALLSILLVIAITTPYWLRVVFITLTVVCALAPSTSVIDFASKRLGETLLGIVILTITGLGLLWWARRGKDGLTLPEVAEPL